MLEAERDEGSSFDKAWRRALRFVEPPEGCPAAVVADILEDRELLREQKPQWQAAYERRDVERAALASGYASAGRRLKDLLLDDDERQREAQSFA